MNVLGEVRAQACGSRLPTPHLKRRDKKGGESLTLNKPSVPTKPAPTPHCQSISSLHKLTPVSLSIKVVNKTKRYDYLLRCAFVGSHDSSFSIALFVVSSVSVSDHFVIYRTNFVLSWQPNSVIKTSINEFKVWNNNVLCFNHMK